MATATMPPLTIALGTDIELLGDTLLPAGCKQIDLALASGVQVGEITVKLWYAPDGTTYMAVPLMTIPWDAAAATHNASYRCETGFPGPAPTIKVTVDNAGLAYLSTGGTVTMT